MKTSVARDANEIRSLANLAAGGRRLDKQPGLSAIPNGIADRTGAS